MQVHLTSKLQYVSQLYIQSLILLDDIYFVITLSIANTIQHAAADMILANPDNYKNNIENYNINNKKM